MDGRSLVIALLSSFAFVPASTRTVTGDNELKNTVKEVIEDMFGGNDSMHDLITEIETLQNRSQILEQKVLHLERENGEKDKIIGSLKKNLQQFLQAELKTGNSYNRTDVNANDVGLGPSLDTHSGPHNLVRTRRQTSQPNIAFSTYLTNTQYHMAPGQTVKFDGIFLNEGHGYNSYTGVFTAPVSGTYLFTFHFHSHVHTFIRLNSDGRNVVDAVANPHLTNSHETESMSGNTVILHVGIGQVLSMEVYDASGEVASSDKYRLATFSGFLIHPE